MTSNLPSCNSARESVACPDLNVVEVLVLLYRPNLELLRRFLQSLTDQRNVNLRASLVYDGVPAPLEGFELRSIAVHFGFPLHFFQSHIGTYRHAERAMRTHLSHDHPFVVADQDDWWMPDRLIQQFELLATSKMSAVTSNAEIYVDNRPTSRFLFDVLQTKTESFRYQLICNHVTGNGTLFSEHILPYALPFPEAGVNAVHDHWLGAVAVALRGVRIDNAVRWHYVQHGANQVGIPVSRLASVSRISSKTIAILRSICAKGDLYVLTVTHFRKCLKGRIPESFDGDTFLMDSSNSAHPRRTSKVPSPFKRLRFSRFEVVRFSRINYRLRYIVNE